jgi:hypothetical protein
MVILRLGVPFLFRSQDSHLALCNAAVLLGGRSFLRCLDGHPVAVRQLTNPIIEVTNGSE